jgi:hypothetical protein
MKGFLIGFLAGVLLAGAPFWYLLRESKEETQTARNSIEPAYAVFRREEVRFAGWLVAALFLL